MLCLFPSEHAPHAINKINIYMFILACGGDAPKEHEVEVNSKAAATAFQLGPSGML